mgnify:CR=1 FL=1
MKIDQIISEVESEGFTHQRKFVKMISFNLAIGIRAINGDEELSDKEKLNAISHLNELQHQITNKSRARFPDQIHRICSIAKNINAQDSNAGKHLGAIINSSYDSLRNTNSEQNLIDKIDCNFPYNDKIESSKLIRESLHYSPNATYSIIEELARIPSNERENVTMKRLIELVEEIDKQFDHHLKPTILKFTRMMIKEEKIQIDEALELMNQISDEKGLWGALAIAYEACEDEENKLENKFDEIRNKWTGKMKADL